MSKFFRFWFVFYIIFEGYTVTCQNSIEVALQAGHSSYINCLAVSQNGQFVASGSNDRTVKIWDLSTGKLLKTLQGHNFEINNVKFDPSSKYLMSHNFAETKVWDILNGTELTTVFQDSVFDISSVAFSPDGNLMAVGTFQGWIKIWNIQSKKLLHSANCHYGNVIALSFDSSSTSLYTFARNGFAVILSLSPFKEIDRRQLKISNAECQMAVYDPSCTFLAVGYSDGKIGLFGNSCKALKYVFSASGNQVTHLEFSAKSNYLCGGSYFTKKIWNTLSGIEMKVGCNPYDTYNSATINNTERIFIFQDYDNLLHLYDIETKKCFELGKEKGKIQALTFTKDDSYFINVSEDIHLKIKDSKKGTLISKFAGNNTFKKFVHSTTKPNVLFIVDSDGNMYNFDLSLGKLEIWDYKLNSPIQLFYYCKNTDLGAILNNRSTVEIIDYKTNKIKHVVTIPAGNVKALSMDNKGKFLILGSSQRNIFINELGSDKKWTSIKSDALTTSVALSPDNSMLAYSGGYYIYIYDMDKHAAIKRIVAGSEKIKTILFSPDGSLLSSINTNKQLKTWETTDWKLKYTVKDPSGFFTTSTSDVDVAFPISFSENSSKIVNQGENWSLLIRDSKTGTFLNRLSGHSSYINSTEFLSGDTLLASSSYDGSVKIWNIQKKDFIASIYIADDQYVIITPDNYYKTSRGNNDMIVFKHGNSSFSFDQFDLQYNRPDIVLERLGFADKDLIDSFRKAYIKRIQKAGFQESMFSTDFHVPETEIVNLESIPLTSDKKEIEFKIQVNDTKYLLDRIQVWINDVPVYGMKGLNLKDKQTSFVVKDIPVVLSVGNNKVEFSCMNNKGVESLKKAVKIIYTPETLTKPNIWFFGVGVSDYQNQGLSLEYAVKDITDMSRALKEKYPDLMVDTLYNSSATTKNIRLFKQLLQKTGIDDIVILSLSGHGFLSSNMDFYFGTYDVDYRNPEINGFSYNEVEWLLDSIPARKKLILLDACHSGEVDKEVTIENYVGKDGENIKIRNHKGVSLSTHKEAISLQNSYELMQELFTNLSRGNGAVVISAAGGLEVAYEGADWQNGIFTYCIRKGLEKAEADLNQDQRITVSELNEYISSQVEILTNGKQRPTSRRDVLENNWVIWEK